MGDLGRVGASVGDAVTGTDRMGPQLEQELSRAAWELQLHAAAASHPVHSGAVEAQEIRQYDVQHEMSYTSSACMNMSGCCKSFRPADAALQRYKSETGGQAASCSWGMCRRCKLKAQNKGLWYSYSSSSSQKPSTASVCRSHAGQHRMHLTHQTMDG